MPCALVKDIPGIWRGRISRMTVTLNFDPRSDPPAVSKRGLKHRATPTRTPVVIVKPEMCGRGGWRRLGRLQSIVCVNKAPETADRDELRSATKHGEDPRSSPIIAPGNHANTEAER